MDLPARPRPRKRLFDDGTVPEGLALVYREIASTGVIMATYRTGAEIKSGSFALDEPSEAELERRAKHGA